MLPVAASAEIHCVTYSINQQPVPVNVISIHILSLLVQTSAHIK